MFCARCATRYFSKNILHSSRQLSFTRPFSSNSGVNQPPRKKKYNQQSTKSGKQKNYRRTNLASLKKRLIVEVPQKVTVAQLAKICNVPEERVIDAVAWKTSSSHIRPNLELYDFTLISSVVSILGFRWKNKAKENETKAVEDLDVYRSPPTTDKSLLSRRPPIVTIMGHIDHGKTTLLDSLRNSNLVQGEAGGITQAIGAFSVNVADGKKVTFLDTPGHAAFSSMRIRGAKLTDIVVLVVAADDGVMEQTIESIKATKQADVPMVVAINKCDLKKAKPKVVLDELDEHGVHVEDLGGNVQVVRMSALKGDGLTELEECILLEADLLEVAADNSAKVEGVVLESRIEKGIGSIASTVIQQGTLTKGKWLVAGTSMARVKGMFDEKRKTLKEALPGCPVDIFGWKSLPNAGDLLLQVDNEAQAHRVVEWRKMLHRKEKEEEEGRIISQRRAEDDKIYQRIRSGVGHKVHRLYALNNTFTRLYTKQTTVPELNIVLKADVDGSLDALLDVIHTYDANDQCILNVVHFGVGSINESDIDRAEIASGLIFAFNVEAPSEMEAAAEERHVKIISNAVIYHLIKNLQDEITDVLPEEKVYETVGEASVLQLFSYSENKVRNTVAGCKVTHGVLHKDKPHILVRDGKIIHEGPLQSMRQNKADVANVKSGKECGLIFDSMQEAMEIGDIIQCCDISNVAPVTKWRPPGF